MGPVYKTLVVAAQHSGGFRGDDVTVLHRSFVLALCAVATVAMPPASGRAQSLVEDLQSLADSHPDIMAKQKALLAAEQSIRAARSGYLPTASLTADTGTERVNNPTRRAVQGEGSTLHRDTSGLTVTQKLFDGYYTDSTVESARISHDIAEAALRATRQVRLRDGALAYTDVLRFGRLIELSRENERKVQEQMNLEDERVQKGAGISSDVLAAKQRLQVAKERRVAFEGSFHEAVATYTLAFGRAPNVAALQDPPLPVSVLPATLEDALATAERENPVLEQAARKTALASEGRRTAESGYYPTLDLVGRGNYEDNKDATIGTRRDWSVLLQANWELFSGFKTDAQVAKASHDYAASRDDQLYSGRQIAESVRKAWYKLQVARERSSLLQNAAVLAEEVWEARKKQREAGKATVQEVLDEETRINDARINYTEAHFDMVQAAYELLTAMGRFELDTVTGPAIPAPTAAAPAVLGDARRPAAGALPVQMARHDLTRPVAGAGTDPAMQQRVQALMTDSGTRSVKLSR